LQDRKWQVDYQVGNREIVIEITDPKQSVYVYACKDSMIKVNRVELEGWEGWEGACMLVFGRWLGEGRGRQGVIPIGPWGCEKLRVLSLFLSLPLSLSRVRSISALTRLSHKPSRSHLLLLFPSNSTHLPATQVQGKVNNIALDTCVKTGIMFTDVISSCEVVNCKGVQLQATGVVPNISVEKTDGCQLFLAKQVGGCASLEAHQLREIE
jgi:hypothetical protein